MSTRTVVVLNGYPRAGKDTAIDCLRSALETRGVKTRAFSSIEPVRKMLRDAGYPVDDKTPAMRLLLSTVGDAVEAFDHSKTIACVWEAGYFFQELNIGQRGVIFLHTREPEVLNRLRFRSEMAGYNFKTLFVQRDSVAFANHSNSADRDVMSISYDRVIPNNGTIAELQEECERVAEWLLD